ncbi:MAG: hypothetical protein J7M08_07785 [Planctomycetes bacterium]|nr:hypothetical protein [Planctomycetota bacterium]
MAFGRRRTLSMLVCGGVFVPAAAAATLVVYWPLSPVLAVALLAFGLGLPLLALLLYVIDRAFAVFCLEMTYPALICWILWPLLVAVNFAGLALR